MKSITINWLECDCCGSDDIVVDTDGDENCLHDGDRCKCPACGNYGNISVDEESGDAWASWNKVD